MSNKDNSFIWSRRVGQKVLETTKKQIVDQLVNGNAQRSDQLQTVCVHMHSCNDRLHFMLNLREEQSSLQLSNFQNNVIFYCSITFEEISWSKLGKNWRAIQVSSRSRSRSNSTGDWLDKLSSSKWRKTRRPISQYFACFKTFIK